MRTSSVVSTTLPTGAIDLVIDSLAAYRLTRLVSVDTLPPAVRARARVQRWARRRNHPAVIELIACPWCIGFWMAGATVVARHVIPRQWTPIARVLAISAVTGIVAYQLSDDVVEVEVHHDGTADDADLVGIAATAAR
jgi:hypothetical protein